MKGYQLTLDTIPEIIAPPVSIYSDTQLLGKSGEYLTAAEFTIAGYEVSLGSEKCSYDLIVQIDSNLHGVQVKSAFSTNPGRVNYSFNAGSKKLLRRSGKVRVVEHTWGRYFEAGVPLMSFVAVDLRRCLIMSTKHLTQHRTSVSFSPAQFLSEDYFELCLKQAIADLRSSAELRAGVEADKGTPQ